MTFCHVESSLLICFYANSLPIKFFLPQAALRNIHVMKGKSITVRVEDKQAHHRLLVNNYLLMNLVYSFVFWEEAKDQL